LLEFAFDNLQQLWTMEGHGPYVWASYGITASAIIGLAIMPSLARSTFIKRQKTLIKRETADD